MARLLFPRFAVTLALPGVLGLTLLPQPHVHGRSGESDNHHQTIHRHFEPHHHDAGPATIVDHGEDPALWIDATAIGPGSPISVHAPGPFVHEHTASTEALPQRLAAVEPLHARGHDPPWAEPLAPRGPPSRLA